MSQRFGVARKVRFAFSIRLVVDPGDYERILYPYRNRLGKRNF
jgi:hypothetical protein